jgi:hypothetical protein
MDVNVFVLLLVFSLLPVILVFLGPKKSGWALIGFFGIAICFLTSLVLSADADLTQISGGSAQVLAASNGNFISDFNVIAWTPIAIGLTEAYIVVRRAFKI